MIYWKRFLCLPVALNLSVVLTSPYLQTCWPLVLRNAVIHHLSYALTVWSRELHCLYKPVSVNQASFVSQLIQLPEFCRCVSMPTVCVSSAQCSWNRLRCGDTKDWAFDLTCKPNFHLYEITQCFLRDPITKNCKCVCVSVFCGFINTLKCLQMSPGSMPVGLIQQRFFDSVNALYINLT